MNEDARMSAKEPGEAGQSNPTSSAAGFGGGQVGAELARQQAAATDALHEGLAEFARKAGQGTPLGQLKGFLFEHIMAAKFNRNAAAAGRAVHAKVTGSSPGGGHSPADIKLVGSSGEKLVQAKASDDPSWLARQATDPKYDGMDVVSPEDQADIVNQKLAERGQSRRVVKELQADGVSSGSTTTKELDQATANPKLYRLRMEAKQVGVEVLDAGAKGAIGGAVVGGALSAIHNVRAYLSGNVDGGTAAKNVAKDTVASAGRGAATSGLGAVVRQTGRHAGLQTLKKSNVATAVASGLIDVGVAVYAFAKGEISAEEAAERIGETGCSTASGVYAGAAAGAILGPPGAVVGSIIGYMAMSWVYQSCLVVLRQARLAEEEAARTVVLCAEATRAMDQQREHFEMQLETWLKRREAAFEQCLTAVDRATAQDETEDAVTALACLAGMTGSALRFKDFGQFDSFMTQSDGPLVL